MASSEPNIFEIDAGSSDEARRKIASTAGVDPQQLEIVDTKALKTWPWQAKRYHYRLAVQAASSQSSHAGSFSKDGSFSTEFKDGVVWLTVTKPEGEGKPVRIEDILAESESWPVDPIEKTALAPIVERAAGKPESIAVYGTAGSEAFRMFLAPNGMSAYVICGDQAPADDPKGQLAAALEAQGVTYGVDHARIEELARRWERGAAIIIARADLPVPGTDAIVEQLFTSAEGQTVREDGSVDFFASQLTAPVKAGIPIVVKHEATTGTEGHTVRGEPIPTQPGKDVDIKRMVGKGATLSEDGMQILAEIDGTPAATQGKYSVAASLTIAENVDFATGNVNFPGSIVINGEIVDGFEVQADGDITARGTVGAAMLKAAGSVALMAGIFGREKGSIVAQGDIKATFLTECTVEAQGSVQVQGEISRSTVTAGDSVVVSGAGKIIGGTIRAGRQVSCNIIGSPTGRAPTQIIVTGEAAGDEGGEAGGRPSVRVHGTVYPPTHITIARARLSVEENTPYCVFVEQNGTIVMLPYA